MKKIALLILAIAMLPLASASPIHEWERNVTYRNITLHAPAVAEGSNGYVGVVMDINVTMMNGSGNVFVVTSPLTQLDMQGSARLAVDVAGMVTGRDVGEYDFLFQVESDAPVVGGPSAGGIMTMGAICLLMNLEPRDDMIMTGMINPDGSIGPVGGILPKGEAAAEAGMHYFLIPKGQSIEYQTVAERSGPFVFYHKVPVNVTQELYDNYGLIVKEVEDINEALAYFTNYSFKEETSTMPVITADYYQDIMKPLAEHVVQEANESYERAHFSFEHTYIPTGYPWNNPRGRVSNSLSTAKDALDDAELALDNAFYYYSISKAFQSKINSLFVIHACQYYNGTDIETIYHNVSAAVSDAMQAAAETPINGLVSLQCVGAAQQRACDAERHLNTSARDPLDRLYDLSYAMERSGTVYWWLNLSTHFNESYEINETGISGLAEKYYDYAQSIVSYADILSEETGYSRQFVTNAYESLNDAQSNKETLSAASLFDSLEAIANANLAIEMIGASGDMLQDKMNRSDQMASYAIQRARNTSIEPILAVSYYEFGKSFELQDVVSTLTYYKYAYMIANMLYLSRGYQPKELQKTETVLSEGDGNAHAFSYVPLLCAGGIGFVAGSVFIAAVGGGRRKSGEEKEERADENIFKE